MRRIVPLTRAATRLPRLRLLGDDHRLDLLVDRLRDDLLPRQLGLGPTAPALITPTRVMGADCVMPDVDAGKQGRRAELRRGTPRLLRRRATQEGRHMRWNCRRRRRCQAPLTVGIALLVSLVTATAASAQADRAVTRLGEGVYFIRHRGEGGNTTIVIGARDVLVVDASGGAATQYDIQQIRALTDKPVRYLLNTHWHGDHNFGTRSTCARFQASPSSPILQRGPRWICSSPGAGSAFPARWPG